MRHGVDSKPGSGGPVLALPLSTEVALDTFLNCLEPQFPPLWSGEKMRPFLRGCGMDTYGLTTYGLHTWSASTATAVTPPLSAEKPALSQLTRETELRAGRTRMSPQNPFSGPPGTWGRAPALTSNVPLAHSPHLEPWLPLRKGGEGAAGCAHGSRGGARLEGCMWKTTGVVTRWVSQCGLSSLALDGEAWALTPELHTRFWQGSQHRPAPPHPRAHWS